nr:G-type lectin S-receptor-like serine/threonine-protein kinase At4g27290 [Populus alba]
MPLVARVAHARFLLAAANFSGEISGQRMVDSGRSEVEDSDYGGLEATAIDTINTTQSIRDGDNITSSGGNYVLGFFSPGNSKNRFLGIWYGKISVMTAVWVANTEAPLNDSSGILRLTDEGILVLLNRSRSVIWSSNTSTPARNAVSQLLDSGNLVVKEKGDYNLENLLWQSFEHPGDTMLPEMKIGRNRITGMDWYLTSWKSTDDPSRGNVSTILVPYGYPEILVMENSIVRQRTGPWNGLRFSGFASFETKSHVHI